MLLLLTLKGKIKNVFLNCFLWSRYGAGTGTGTVTVINSYSSATLAKGAIFGDFNESAEKDPMWVPCFKLVNKYSRLNYLTGNYGERTLIRILSLGQSRRRIRLIEDNAKRRHLKKIYL
jgi:hypothetical protein